MAVNLGSSVLESGPKSGDGFPSGPPGSSFGEPEARFIGARGLGGGEPRARQLAQQAHATFVRLGLGFTQQAAWVERWLDDAGVEPGASGNQH